MEKKGKRKGRKKARERNIVRQKKAISIKLLIQNTNLTRELCKLTYRVNLNIITLEV